MRLAFLEPAQFRCARTLFLFCDLDAGHLGSTGRIFTAETQSSQRSEYFLIQELFTLHAPRLRGEFSSSSRAYPTINSGVKSPQNSCSSLVLVLVIDSNGRANGCKPQTSLRTW